MKWKAGGVPQYRKKAQTRSVLDLTQQLPHLESDPSVS